MEHVKAVHVPTGRRRRAARAGDRDRNGVRPTRPRQLGVALSCGTDQRLRTDPGELGAAWWDQAAELWIAPLPGVLFHVWQVEADHVDGVARISRVGKEPDAFAALGGQPAAMPATGCPLVLRTCRASLCRDGLGGDGQCPQSGDADPGLSALVYGVPAPWQVTIDPSRALISGAGRPTRRSHRWLLAGERDGQAGLDERRGQDQRMPPSVAAEGGEFVLGRVEGLNSTRVSSFADLQGVGGDEPASLTSAGCAGLAEMTHPSGRFHRCTLLCPRLVLAGSASSESVRGKPCEAGTAEVQIARCDTQK
jgi:hypothetical protein